jgi:hypothetical protein
MDAFGTGEKTASHLQDHALIEIDRGGAHLFHDRASLAGIDEV